MEASPSNGPIKDSQLHIFENVGISISDGKIQAIAPLSDLSGPLEEIPQPAVALPGFIDAHTHLCFAGSRCHDYAMRLNGIGYEEIAASGGGILDTVRQTRNASLEELTALTSARLLQVAGHGVTTCEVKSGYGLSLESELKILRSIAKASKEQCVSVIPTCLAAHTLPPEFNSTTTYLNYILEHILPIIQAEGLAQRVDIFVDDSAFGVAEAIEYLKKAKHIGFAVCVHADQFSRGGVQVATAVNALSADHLEQSKSADFTAMQKAGVIPIVLPGASLGLGMPFPPARAILDHHLPLVIASDWNPGSGPMGDLLTQAALLGAAQCLTMAETLAAITVRAARALALTDRGALVSGLRADLALFPCSDYREILYHQGSLKPFATYIHGSRTDGF